MTRVDGQHNKWKISFTPNIRTYFNVPVSDNIYRISCVFRSADGNKKGTIPPGDYGWGTVTSNFDIYINLDAGDYIQFNQPFNDFGIYNPDVYKRQLMDNIFKIKIFVVFRNDGFGIVVI